MKTTARGGVDGGGEGGGDGGGDGGGGDGGDGGVDGDGESIERGCCVIWMVKLPALSEKMESATLNVTVAGVDGREKLNKYVFDDE